MIHMLPVFCMFLFSYYSTVGDVGREGLLLQEGNIIIEVLV